MSAVRVDAVGRAGARPLVRALMLTGCALGLLAVAPSAASAGFAAVNGSTLSYSASSGEVNALRISRAGSSFVLEDAAGIVADAPCLPDGLPLPSGRFPRVTCPAANIGLIVVDAGDGNDVVDITADGVQTSLAGGSGNDVLRGGSGRDELIGGGGDDELDGRDGADALEGGAGADRLSGGAGADAIACGADAVRDTVTADSSDAVAPDCAGDAVSVTALAAAPAPAPPPAAVAAAPAIELLNPFPVVRIRGAVTRTGARIDLLSVTAPRGARVEVRCRGRSCPARRASSAAGRGLRFRRFQRPLAAGVVLEVRVTKAATIGKYVRITIRRGRSPLRLDMCLRPGAERPVTCSAA